MKQLIFCCFKVPSIMLWSFIEVVNHAYHRKAILIEAFLLNISLLESRLIVSLELLSVIGIED